MKLVVLWTDAVVFLLIAAIWWYAFKVTRTPHLAATWRKAFVARTGAATATILTLFALVGVLDSMHFRTLLPDSNAATPSYSAVTRSVLDVILAKQEASRETSYSAPLAYLGYEKEAQIIEGKAVRVHPRLKFGGAALTDPENQWGVDVATRVLGGAVVGALLTMLACGFAAALRARSAGIGFNQAWQQIKRRETSMPIKTVLITLGVFFVLAGIVGALASQYHVFGTDRVGNDLLYVVLKSIRTALVIGTMTTLVTLPIAVGLGILAGYLRGWVDEVIQYVYTVINSIPYVLLIAAAVLILLNFIDAHPEMFQTAAERTDARLFFLCVILGMTSWTELCRLIRGEVMKLREFEYVQAAQAFGVGTWRIMTVHLLPNVMHLILITVVISFSGLVLAEAILSYVGVGVDPSMASFGMLINTARLELSREPAIWWTLATAFAFMFALVLSANIFADAVRDAFDPRSLRR